MQASFVDLRTKSAEIIRALDRNEQVTLLYRGRPKAIILPISNAGSGPKMKTADHPAIGMWADRDDLQDVTAHVRRIRKGRFDDL